MLGSDTPYVCTLTWKKLFEQYRFLRHVNVVMWHVPKPPHQHCTCTSVVLQSLLSLPLKCIPSHAHSLNKPLSPKLHIEWITLIRSRLSCWGRHRIEAKNTAASKLILTKGSFTQNESEFLSLIFVADYMNLKHVSERESEFFSCIFIAARCEHSIGLAMNPSSSYVAFAST